MYICLNLLRIHTTVISEPDDDTICEGDGAVFTCVLIKSNDVQWYRFIKNTSTTVMVEEDKGNFDYLVHTNGNITNNSLIITNAIKSYTGYFWVRTPSGDVCNTSLTVMGKSMYCMYSICSSRSYVIMYLYVVMYNTKNHI